jgi:hypothetical protein
MAWLVNNIASVAVLLAVVLLIALLIRSLIKSKKSGNSSCSSCQGCAMAGKCPSFRPSDEILQDSVSDSQRSDQAL